MGKKDPQPQRVTIDGNPLNCLMCKHDVFRQRDVKLNSGTRELIGLAWADESASGLICWSCGYVHLFANKSIKLQAA